MINSHFIRSIYFLFPIFFFAHSASSSPMRNPGSEDELRFKGSMETLAKDDYIFGLEPKIRGLLEEDKRVGYFASSMGNVSFSVVIQDSDKAFGGECKEISIRKIYKNGGLSSIRHSHSTYLGCRFPEKHPTWVFSVLSE